MRIRQRLRKPAVRRSDQKESRPWLAVVMSLKDIFESQYWRLSVVDNLYGWREFVVAWVSVARELQGVGAASILVSTPLREESEIEWAWLQVEPSIPDILHSLVSMCPLDELTVATCYHVLRNACLIYPDGTASTKLLDRISRDVAIRESFAALRLAKTRSSLKKITSDLSQRNTKP